MRPGMNKQAWRRHGKSCSVCGLPKLTHAEEVEEVVFVRSRKRVSGFMRVHCLTGVQYSEARSFAEFVAMVAGHGTDRGSFCSFEVFRLMASFAEAQMLQAFPQLVCCLISEPHVLGTHM